MMSIGMSIGMSQDLHALLQASTNHWTADMDCTNVGGHVPNVDIGSP